MAGSVPPRAPRPAPKASKRPFVLLLAALAFVAGAVVVQRALRAADDTEKDQPVQAVPDTGIPPNEDNDPDLVAAARDYCTSRPTAEVAGRMPAYDPKDEAYSTVFWDQAIGAGSPTVRTEWYLQPLTPELGFPMDSEEFGAVDVTKVRLATCLDRRGTTPSSKRCAFTGDPALGAGDAQVTLVATTYDVTVYEIRTGKVLTTGQVLTDTSACPASAMPEGEDYVSGPMTDDLIRAWFAEHLAGGTPS